MLLVLAAGAPPPLRDVPVVDAIDAVERAELAPAAPVDPREPVVDPVETGLPQPSPRAHGVVEREQRPLPERSSDFTVAMMQFGVTAASCAACVCCSVVPVPGCALLAPLLLPVANGYTVAFLGDRYGNDRGAALWPIVASYAAIIGGAGFGLAGLGLAFGIAPSIGVGPSAQLTPVFVVGGIVGLVGIIAVPLSYWLGAEPKHDDDDGSQAPALFGPAHPVPAKHRSTTRTAPAASVMQF